MTSAAGDHAATLPSVARSRQRGRQAARGYAGGVSVDPALAPAAPLPARPRVVRWLALLLGEPLPHTAPEAGSTALLVWCCVWAATAMFLGDAYDVRGPTPLGSGMFRVGVHGALPFAAIGLWELWRHGRLRVFALLGAAIILAPLLYRTQFPGASKVVAAAPFLTLLLPFAVGAVLIRVGLSMAGSDPTRWGMGLGDWRWWVPRTAFLAACIVPLCALGGWLSPQLLSFYPRWRPAQTDTTMLAIYFTALFIDLYGWEFLWRGFLLNAFARRGDPLVAILASAIPFFLLHYPKPDLEMLSSFPGGILAGWFCLRARSSLPMWILHCVLFATMGIIGFFARTP